MTEKAVLIVDDEEQIREMWKKALSRKGYVPFCTRSTQETLKILAEKDFPVAFIDIHLSSQSNGIDLGRKIRNRNSSIALYAMSGYASSEIRSECLEAGFNDFIGKPVSIHQLLEILREVFLVQSLPTEAQPG